MKLQRLGNTENCLTYIYFLEEILKKDYNNEELKSINNHKKTYIDWIYKTAGYYDKSVKIKSRYTLNDYTINLKTYISNLLESYRDSDILYIPFFKSFEKTVLSKYMDEYRKYLNAILLVENGFIYYLKTIKSYILNKRVLLITPFSELIKDQVDNNNFNVLYNNIYKDTNFIYYKFPYKFMNTGPDNNNFETLEKIKNEIKDIEFDIALLSCGADAGIISNYINEIGKDAIYIGGNLPIMFGIFGKREKNNAGNKLLYENENIDDFSPYIITDIPDKYKPENYKQIEDGCYW